jgi:RNA polymerase sigma-70 factor (ECF subfamily)
VVTGNSERANDVAQATCVRAIEKAHLFDPETKLDRWVFRMAQRLWLNELRSDAVRRGGGMATLAELDLPDPRPDAEENIFFSQVMVEVMRLPEAQRVTVLLVYVEGHSYREASETLDIPIGTVMSRLAAARGSLAKIFQVEKGVMP